MLDFKQSFKFIYSLGVNFACPIHCGTKFGFFFSIFFLHFLPNYGQKRFTLFYFIFLSFFLLYFTVVLVQLKVFFSFFQISFFHFFFLCFWHSFCIWKFLKDYVLKTTDIGFLVKPAISIIIIIIIILS